MDYRYTELSPTEIADLIEFALNQRKRQLGRQIGGRDLTFSEESLVQIRYAEVQGVKPGRALAIREEGWRYLGDALRHGAERALHTLPWRQVRDALDQRGQR